MFVDGGCYDGFTAKAFFNFASSVTDRIQEDSICIEADTIDALLQDKKVTYIKMDIEGAELEAIKGAKKVIQE